MSYEKQTWATGQVITAEKLNHIEDGIEAVEQEIPTDAYEKPAGGIPDADIASASVWNAKGTYSKPSGGIPATDLATAVQTSLGKADTALQTETDPTVPSWAKASTKPTPNTFPRRAFLHSSRQALTELRLFVRIAQVSLRWTFTIS